MGSWVPTAALFVLVVGSADPAPYVGMLLSLMLLGAAVGTLLLFAFPQFPLVPGSVACDQLSLKLIDQLLLLADGLDGREAPSEEQWQRHRLQLLPGLAQMRAWSLTALEARRWNWVARRYRSRSEQQLRRVQALERSTVIVEDLTVLISDTKKYENDELALGTQLRPSVADSLRGLADVLRSTNDSGSSVQRTQESIDSLVSDIERERITHPGSGLFVASELVASLRRVLSLLDTNVDTCLKPNRE